MNDQISLQCNKIIRIIENEEQFKTLTDKNILKLKLNDIKKIILSNLNELKINNYQQESDNSIKNHASQTNLIKNENNLETSIVCEKMKNLAKSKEKKYLFFLMKIITKFIQEFYKILKTKFYDFEDYLIVLFLSESEYKINSALISDRENYKKYISEQISSDYPTYSQLSRDHKKHFCISYLTLNDFIKFIEEIIENIQFITIDEAQKKYTILQQNNIDLGEYILHPKDKSKLIPTMHYYTSITKTKNDELIDLLAQMGAKEIKISEKIQKNTSIDTNLEAKALFLSSNATFSIEKDYYNFFEIKASFFVSPHHIVDPNLIKKSIWFNGDSQIETIFKYRISNTVSIQNYSINIECNKTQKIEFSLNANIKLLFNIKLDFDYNSISKRELIFDVKF